MVVLEVPVTCRAETRPFTAHRLLPAWLAAAFLVAFALTAWRLQQAGVADRFADAPAEYGIWTAVFGTVTGYAAASAVYGWFFLLGVLQLSNGFVRRQRWRWILQVLMILGAINAAMAFSSARTASHTEHRLQIVTLPLIIAASVFAVPALAGFLGLRAVALDDQSWAEPPASRLKLLIRLRAECQHLLVVLSVLLTLLVITTGLRRHALLAIDVETPAESVLLYGLVFAVLLALFYLAASTALDSRSMRFLNEHAELPDPDAADLSADVSRRKDLASLIGVGGSWSTFATVVVVASPLLTALIASATGK
jgi:hypothetical protein